IEAGCRIHISAPPFDHTKLITIDGVWSLIGSTNWDPRSFRLNFEFNVECYSAALAESLQCVIDAKIGSGREIAMEEITNAPFAIKLRNGLARLAAPYL
ncbi:MAG: phospholipase D-like domain-containing protein, partial [Verrucomicrobiota bacterium]